MVLNIFPLLNQLHSQQNFCTIWSSCEWICQSLISIALCALHWLQYSCKGQKWMVAPLAFCILGEFRQELKLSFIFYQQSQIDEISFACFCLVVKTTNYLVNWNQSLPACQVFPGSICPVQREHFPHHFLIIFLIGALIAVVAVCLLKRRELRMELAKNRFLDLK